MQFDNAFVVIKLTLNLTNIVEKQIITKKNEKLIAEKALLSQKMTIKKIVASDKVMTFVKNKNIMYTNIVIIYMKSTIEMINQRIFHEINLKKLKSVEDSNLLKSMKNFVEKFDNFTNTAKTKISYSLERDEINFEN